MPVIINDICNHMRCVSGQFKSRKMLDKVDNFIVM
jgi:hypothetical protein